MRWVMGAGCAVIAVGAMAGVARAYCEGSRQEEELAVVPSGGGVLVAQRQVGEGCRMMMVGGGRWVPLEAERGPGPEVVLWRPVRRLVPGVVYDVVGVDEDGQRVRYLRAVAGKSADRVAPRWRRSPRVARTVYSAGCLVSEAVVEFELAVEDESAVRVTIEARALDGGDGDAAMTAVVRPERGRAMARWPARGEWFMRPGVRYAARACAEDVAGNRSCARAPAMFTAPEWEPYAELGMSLPLLVARLLWRERVGLVTEPAVVGVPPPDEEKLERVRAPRARVDWRCASAGAAGALLVMALAAMAHTRRAARRRVSRAA